LAIRVEDQHKVGPAHVDIGFVLNRDSAEVPILWDCVAGVGKTEVEVISRAVETWVATTVPAVLEMLVRDGSFASQYGYDDPQGSLGWHVIHGPILAWGAGSAPTELQSWALNNPILPIIGPIVASAFERKELNGVKVIFGFGSDDIAEVRINGVKHEEASVRLKGLKWPRAKDVAFARCYWLFVHGR
jgi:hypothetical protein